MFGPGVVVSSQYSGYRCFEQLLDMTLSSLAEQGHSTLETSRSVVFYSASEIDEATHAAMLQCPVQVKALHNFGDLELRLSDDFIKELNALDPGSPCCCRVLTTLPHFTTPARGIRHCWVELLLVPKSSFCGSKARRLCVCRTYSSTSNE